MNNFWEPSVSYKKYLVFPISRLIVSEFPGNMKKKFLISKETEVEGIFDIYHLCSIKCNIIIIKYKSQSIYPGGAKVWVILAVQKIILPVVMLNESKGNIKPTVEEGNDKYQLHLYDFWCEYKS